MHLSKPIAVHMIGTLAILCRVHIAMHITKPIAAHMNLLLQFLYAESIKACHDGVAVLKEKASRLHRGRLPSIAPVLLPYICCHLLQFMQSLCTSLSSLHSDIITLYISLGCAFSIAATSCQMCVVIQLQFMESLCISLFPLHSGCL